MNLQNICYERLADSIENSPPLIQENIIGETCTRITKRITKKIESKTQKETSDIIYSKMPNLVSSIIYDILACKSDNSRIRTDFYKEFSYLPHNIIKCAIIISNSAVDIFNTHDYSNLNMILNGNSNYRQFPGDMSFSDEESDY